MNHYGLKFKMIQNGPCWVIPLAMGYPHGNLGNFLNHLNMIVHKIHCEKKYCVVLGDFNLHLLKFESHPSTENFLNTLGSYYFQYQILQPTRITDPSATLIDNIFFNSLEHFSISGNLCYDLLSDHLPNFLSFNCVLICVLIF